MPFFNYFKSFFGKRLEMGEKKSPPTILSQEPPIPRSEADTKQFELRVVVRNSDSNKADSGHASGSLCVDGKPIKHLSFAPKYPIGALLSWIIPVPAKNHDGDCAMEYEEATQIFSRPLSEKEFDRASWLIDSCAEKARDGSLYYSLPASLTSRPNFLLTIASYMLAGTKTSVAKATHGHEQNAPQSYESPPETHNCMTALFNAMGDIFRQEIEIPVTPDFAEGVLLANGFNPLPNDKAQKEPLFRKFNNL